MKDQLMAEVKKAFKPEFLNRVDDIIVFKMLTKNELKQIIDLELSQILERLKGKRIDLELTEPVKDFLIEKGYDPKFGARPLKRAIERHIEDTLAEELLKAKPSKSGKLAKKKIKAVMENGKVVFINK